MLTKRSVGLLLILAMLLLFVACSRTSNVPKETGSNSETGNNDDGSFTLSPQSDKIVGWLWSGDANDPIVSEFVRKYPDFTVDNSEPTEGVFGDRTVDLPRFAGSIASNEQPDAFFSWVPAIEAYYSNLFMPIQKFIDADPEFKLEEFDDKAFEETTFNNQIYFLPKAYTAQILAWNKDLFESVGLDPEKPPQTWEEYMHYGKS